VQGAKKLVQPLADLGEARIGAGFVLVATRRTADAEGADRFAADLACAGKGPVRLDR
jgi:hypothetical protein